TQDALHSLLQFPGSCLGVNERCIALVVYRVESIGEHLLRAERVQEMGPLKSITNDLCRLPRVICRAARDTELLQKPKRNDHFLKCIPVIKLNVTDSENMNWAPLIPDNLIELEPLLAHARSTQLESEFPLRVDDEDAELWMPRVGAQH